MNAIGRTHRRGERVAVTALVAYSLVLAFLLGPAIRGALATGEGGLADIGGAPAAPAPAAKAADAPPAAPAVVPDAADPAVDALVPLPELTSADAARASAILEADRRFRALVGDAAYTVERIGPWTTSNGPWTARKTPELLGASLIVSFASPIRIADKTIPGAIYDVTERRSPPYQEVDLRVDASSVGNLMILVDLRRGRVVHISPGLGSQVERSTPPPGFRREVPNLSNDRVDPADRPAASGGAR
jgi:hypothetical protein